MFTFTPDLSRNPPDRWVVEQHSFNSRLYQVDQIVATPNMRQFVSQNRLFLLL